MDHTNELELAQRELSKLKLLLRGWLEGRAEDNPEYYIPLRALDFIERNGYDKGFRKDGVTPAFLHQVQIAHHLRTHTRTLLKPAQVIAAAILHDVMEDYDVEKSVLIELVGEEVAEAVWKLTKKFKGVEKPYSLYFSEIATCLIASVVKGADRINNVQSMLGVFTVEKQKKYVQEVKEWFLPMLKKARRQFPEQGAVYESLKFILNSQVELFAAIHAATEASA